MIRKCGHSCASFACCSQGEPGIPPQSSEQMEGDREDGFVVVIDHAAYTS